jgi:2-aminoethylphosphonate dioxygenase
VSTGSDAPVRRCVVSGSGVSDLQGWAAEVESWPAGSHLWGHYAEQTAGGEAICRSELASEVVDFKDKINYKQPGGAGFSPHQDLPAYPGASSVVSLLVAIDDCTRESGCLWIADGVDHILPTDKRGVVESGVADHLDWTPVELAAGDVLCIAGLLPHYSEANRSSSPRRVLVASYAPENEGYRRDGYYEARRAGIEESTARDGQFRISTLADFEGVEVRSANPAATDHCTHPGS